jgi:DNA-binding FadR family transcriptional regulator
MKTASNEIFGQAEPRSTTVEQVIQTIRSALLEKRLKPGEQIPNESELAEQLKVGRGSIREAMKILSAFGIVDIKRGDGTYVGTTANKKIFDPLLFRLLVVPSDIEELAELRILVETGIASLLVANAGEDDIEALARTCAELETCMVEHPDEPSLALPLDIEFHSRMGRATRNKLVENLYAFVIELFTPTMLPGHGIESHLALVEALRMRDVDAATAAVREHDRIWRTLNLDRLKDAKED